MSKTLAIAFVLTASTLAGAQTHIATRTAITGWNIARAVHATVDQNSDGYHDMVMGAPGANGGQGTIRCVSGDHFTTELWSLTPAMPNAAGFGSSQA